MLRRVLPFAIAIGLACVSGPRAPEPGKSGAWGYLRLVPREGLDPGHGQASYGDRRLRDLVFVDYSRPGFAVVYIEARERALVDQVQLTIRDAQVQPRLEPAYAALRIPGRLRVLNASGESRVLSSPDTGLVRQLAPGESTDIELHETGAYSLFLLDVPGSQSTVFAAPGPYAVVSESGRFELRNLEPGRRRLGTWHPRSPPTSRWVDLAVGEMLRLDLAMGVGRGDEVGSAAN